MSTYSTQSKQSEIRSRPTSYAFPAFHSSLPYTLVRDFAYGVAHPLHYGPLPDASEAPSGNTTPASEMQSFSNSGNPGWDAANQQWSANQWASDEPTEGQRLPQIAYGDGPPYSEDEDLQSPVVASRHKKSRSGQGKGKGKISDDHGVSYLDGAEYTQDYAGQRSYFAGVNGDGNEMYYLGDDDESANGPGGELVTYPPDQARQGMLAPKSFGGSLSNRSNGDGGFEGSDDETGSGVLDEDDSRYSRDYQFTITSPDEEMHGKAVALFDFARENENELPLVEGQIIWVSYRHGQGWLVAEDPKTGDAGLVPEEYVRLLRDIEGGWSSLSGEDSPTMTHTSNTLDDNIELASPTQATAEAASTPTQPSHVQSHSTHSSNGSNHEKSEKRPPIVSTFSTSSKDLDPYPHNLRGTQSGATPPVIVHQISQQTGTPLTSPPISHSTESINSGQGGHGDQLEAQIDKLAIHPDAEKDGSSKREEIGKT